MTEAVALNIHGIKCDAEDCGFEDKTVNLENYPEWVNKPCPDCGANLLTEADYNNVLMIMEIVKMTNMVVPPSNTDEEKITMAIEMNGTGSMDLHLKK